MVQTLISEPGTLRQGSLFIENMCFNASYLLSDRTLGTSRSTVTAVNLYFILTTFRLCGEECRITQSRQRHRVQGDGRDEGRQSGPRRLRPLEVGEGRGVRQWPGKAALCYSCIKILSLGF